MARSLWKDLSESWDALDAWEWKSDEDGYNYFLNLGKRGGEVMPLGLYLLGGLVI